jgi:hypothetical protein
MLNFVSTFDSLTRIQATIFQKPEIKESMGCAETSSTIFANNAGPLLFVLSVKICSQINHMKLDKHTQILLLSPSVRIARSKLFYYYYFSQYYNLRCYNSRHTLAYIDAR